MARTNVPVTDLTPVKATYTTSLAGTNNDLVFTAKKGGTWGNSLQIEYLDPGGTTATLTVTVSGFLVSVSLGRASSAIVSTSAQVKAAIEASLDAAALYDITHASSNDGTGVVTALAVQTLSGGTYATTLPSLTNGDATNKHYLTGNDGKVVLRVVSSDAGTQTVTINRSPTLRVGASPSSEVVSISAGATREMGPFPTAEFNQNSNGDVYFEPSVSNNLDFLAYRISQVT